jgi:hypothetical protein
VGTDTELVEKLGRNAHVHAGQDGAFRHCCRKAGRFDGTPAAYYVRDRGTGEKDSRQVQPPRPTVNQPPR